MYIECPLYDPNATANQFVQLLHYSSDKNERKITISDQSVIKHLSNSSTISLIVHGYVDGLETGKGIYFFFHKLFIYKIERQMPNLFQAGCVKWQKRISIKLVVM